MFDFLAHLGITAFALWLASLLFRGITFDNLYAMTLSALLLGFANAVIRPLIIFLTIPLTLVTFGLFLLVINALMLQMVSGIVPGFKVSGFWTAFFASIFIAVVSTLVGLFIFQSSDHPIIIPEQSHLLYI